MYMLKCVQEIEKTNSKIDQIILFLHEPTYIVT